MSHLRAPAASLAGFPRYIVEPSQALLRIHRADKGPWWFNSSGKMRFDLPDPMGTCYVSEGDEGAFLEVFQDWLVIPRAEIDARRISRHLHLPAPWTVADCTNPLSRGFGLTAEIHSTPLRALTQAWAKQFQEEGFAGVRYKVGHDPSQTRTAIALFHAAGEASWSFPVPESIGDDLINRIEATFGVRVR